MDTARYSDEWDTKKNNKASAINKSCQQQRIVFIEMRWKIVYAIYIYSSGIKNNKKISIFVDLKKMISRSAK